MVKVGSPTRNWLIEISAPTNADNYASFFARIEPLLDYTCRFSLASKPNSRLRISGYESNFKFTQYLLNECNGAVGDNKSRSLDILFHLTCFDLDRDNLQLRLSALRNELGVKRVLVVTGDDYVQVDTGRQFENSAQLIETILDEFPGLFDSVGAAAYPGGNGRETSDSAQELGRLERKISAGVDALYTQCLFEANEYELFFKQLKRRHPKVQIVPSVALFVDATDLGMVSRLTRSADTRPARAALDSGRFNSARDYIVELCRRLREIEDENVAFGDDRDSSIDLCTFQKFGLAFDVLSNI